MKLNSPLFPGLLVATVLAATVSLSAAGWPEPRVVNPGPTGGIPADAVVLFDGQDLSQFRGQNGEPKWKVAAGVAEVNGTGNLFSKEEFGDCQLHVEWSSPNPPTGTDQSRGNSGVYLQGRYEIQVLDSYQSKTYPDGQAGAFYNNFPPLVNVSRPPGEVQIYDIIFHAPKADAGSGAVVPGSFTVLHNGVLVQDHVPIKAPTVAAAFDKPSPNGRGPLMLQDHGSPVHYHRIWLRPLSADPLPHRE